MKIIKLTDLERLIPIEYFDICKIDGETRARIAKMYNRKQVTSHKSCYYLEKFAYHIKLVGQIDLQEYCKKYLNIDWPKCPINGKEVGYRVCGLGIKISKFNGSVTREFSKKFNDACDRFSEERRGSGNPMFGRAGWNKGMTKDTSESVRRISEAMKIRPVSERARMLSRERMNKRIKDTGPLHAIPHTDEVKEKMRIHTAKLWASGVFSKITSIHVKMRNFLNSLSLSELFREEYQVVYYSLDFAFPEAKIAIECDGDFFHSNPIFYPNGPETKIQKRNFGRDKAKNKFLNSLGWEVIRFWECEINAESFKEKLLCKLKELNLLKS